MEKTKELLKLPLIKNMMEEFKIKRCNEISIKPELALLVFKRNIMNYACRFEIICSLVWGTIFIVTQIFFKWGVYIGWSLTFLYTIIYFMFKWIFLKTTISTQKKCIALGLEGEDDRKLKFNPKQFYISIVFRIIINILILSGIGWAKDMPFKIMIADILMIVMIVSLVLIFILLEYWTYMCKFYKIDKEIKNLRSITTTININGTLKKALLMHNNNVVKEVDLEIYNILVNETSHIVSVCKDTLLCDRHKDNYILCSNSNSNSVMKDNEIDSIIIYHYPNNVIINIDNMNRYL